MNTSSLHPGDRIEVRVNGGTFTARYDGRGNFTTKPHLITPEDRWRTTRHVSANQIVKKLETTTPKGAA